MKNENCDRKSTCDDYKYNHCDGCGANKPKYDLISREALKKAIEQGEGFSWDSYGKDDLCVRKKYIDNAPTVDCIEFNRAKELIKQAYQKGKDIRPQGEWIKWNFKTFGAMGDWEYKCSNCEKVYGGEYNFCPNCGADMRGDNNGSNDG